MTESPQSEYYHTTESVQEYITLAKDVNGAELIEHLKQVLPLQSSLLELGSGPGSDWFILKKLYDVTGSDYSEEFLAHLNAAYPTGTFLRLDASSLDTLQSFDGIYSNKVLHHLSDEQLEQSVIRQHEVLSPKGIICHSFWKGEGSEVFKGMFVNYHKESELRTLFSKSFEIISISEYDEFESKDSLLLIARKKA